MKEKQKTPSIFHLFRLANNLFYSRTADWKDELPEEEISHTQSHILLYIYRSAERDVYQKDVEKEFGITRSTASRMMMQLEQRGLVERVGVQHDARLKKMLLTEKAVGICQSMMQCGNEVDRILLNGFLDHEVAQLESYIARMVVNAEESYR